MKYAMKMGLQHPTYGFLGCLHKKKENREISGLISDVKPLFNTKITANTEYFTISQ